MTEDGQAVARVTDDGDIALGKVFEDKRARQPYTLAALDAALQLRCMFGDVRLMCDGPVRLDALRAVLDMVAACITKLHVSRFACNSHVVGMLAAEPMPKLEGVWLDATTSWVPGMDVLVGRASGLRLSGGAAGLAICADPAKLRRLIVHDLDCAGIAAALSSVALLHPELEDLAVLAKDGLHWKPPALRLLARISQGGTSDLVLCTIDAPVFKPDFMDAALAGTGVAAVISGNVYYALQCRPLRDQVDRMPSRPKLHAYRHAGTDAFTEFMEEQHACVAALRGLRILFGSRWFVGRDGDHAVGYRTMSFLLVRFIRTRREWWAALVGGQLS
jgi:hypothetical protein